MFRISILKMRLDRHKINAPQKYAKLDQKLKADPRLRVTSDWYSNSKLSIQNYVIKV